MVAGLGDQHPVVNPQSKSTAAVETGNNSSPVGSILPSKEILPQANMPEWNTKNLGQRLAVDAACGATAGFLVAPIVSMVDK
jgi:hypothetical protein